MDSKEYYKVLCVDTKCTQSEIEDAYCTLALKYHPDKNKGTTTDMFLLINEAYDMLSDINKRQTYDASGIFKMDTGKINIKNTKVWHLSPDILNLIMNKKRNINNNTYTAKIALSLEDIYNGVNRLESVNIKGNKTKLVNVIIEPGCPIDKIIRINKGNIPMEFTVIEKPHNTFTRKGYDLYMETHVSLKQYVNEFTVIVPLLNGKSKIIKQSYGGTTIEQIRPLKLSGMGMPRGHTDKYGDLYINIKITLPKLL